MSDERLAKGFEQLMAKVFTQHLKGLHKEAYTCSAKCCDSAGDQSSLQNCLNRCQVPLVRANEIVQEHLGGFQGALQRSVAVCQDEANAARLSKKSDAEVEKTFNTCLDKATSKFADRLPALQDAISASLKQL